MQYPIRVYKDADGVYIAECMVSPRCVTKGTTEKGALAAMRKAIKLAIKVRAERALSIRFSAKQLNMEISRSVYKVDKDSADRREKLDVPEDEVDRVYPPRETT